MRGSYIALNHGRRRVNAASWTAKTMALKTRAVTNVEVEADFDCVMSDLE